MSCLCACFDGIVSIVQSVHVTSWNYSFPSHSTTHLIGKHMCKYSSKNNIKQSNTRCAESMARRKKKTSNWHRIVVLSWTTLIRLSCCSALLHSFSQTLVVFLVLWSCKKQNMRTEPHPRLEKHADDGHHRKSSVSDFGIKLFGFLSRVRSGQHLESKVSSIRSTSWGLFLGDLAESHVGQDLTPSSRVGILGLSTTHINQQNNK